MREELERERLEVELIPAKEGEGKVRAVVNRNPSWYRWLCSKHEYKRGKRRLGQTKIKRRHIIETLMRMEKGIMNSKYNEDIKKAAEIKIEEEQELMKEWENTY